MMIERNISNGNSRATTLSGIARTIIVMIFMSGSIVTTTYAAAPEVPNDISDLYYRLGGGQFLPPPGALNPSFNIRSRFKIGLGYSCGQFDFQNNVKQMVNQYRTKMRQLPGQLKAAVTAAIMSLPGYLMQ